MISGAGGISLRETPGETRKELDPLAASKSRHPLPKPWDPGKVTHNLRDDDSTGLQMSPALGWPMETPGKATEEPGLPDATMNESLGRSWTTYPPTHSPDLLCEMPEFEHVAVGLTQKFKS